MSDSGHCISCEHFAIRDSLPKRNNQHCKLSMAGVGLVSLHVSVVPHLTHCHIQRRRIGVLCIHQDQCIQVHRNYNVLKEQ